MGCWIGIKRQFFFLIPRQGEASLIPGIINTVTWSLNNKVSHLELRTDRLDVLLTICRFIAKTLPIWMYTNALKMSKSSKADFFGAQPPIENPFLLSIHKHSFHKRTRDLEVKRGKRGILK